MRLKIFLALMLPFLCMVASAQNPVVKVFKVEYRTAAGNDTIIEVSTIGNNGFGFIGSKGIWTHYNETIEDFETFEAENRDACLYVSKVDDQSANIKAYFSDAIGKSDFESFGYCISKTPNPQVSDNSMQISNYNGILDLSNFYQIYGEGCYTLNIAQNEIATSVITVKGLSYINTYYIRSYVKFRNGFIMYSGEKSLTALKTKAAVLAAEEELDNSLLFEDSIVFTKETLSGLIDSVEEISIDLRYGIEQDLSYLVKSMNSTDKAELLKKVNKTIECVDGNLYLINECPAGIIDTFKKNFGGGIEFSAAEAITFEGNLTKLCEVDTAYCDASLGVPYNSYLRVRPLAATGNPTIGLNIPKYLHAGKEYDIYAVFVHSDITGDTLPNKFRIELQERKPSSESGKKGSYKRTQRSDDYINNASNSVDTCFVGRYTFLGTPDPVIQIISRVGSREKEYSRTICISKIYIVPVKENE